MAKRAGQREIMRFSCDGKTFFFNAHRTKTGEEFLVINALRGPYKDRLAIFQSQMAQFRDAVEQALGAWGVRSGAGVPDVCPDCGSGPKAFELNVANRKGWNVICKKCGGQVISCSSSTEAV